MSTLTEASATVAASLLPIDVSADATDATLNELAQAAVEYAAEVDAVYAAEPDAHAEDMASPNHGSDYDPCSICNPYDHDLAVAHLARLLRESRDTA